MNSRDRIKIAFNHEEPDKVPLDFGGDVSSIHRNAYLRLLKYLEIEDPNIVHADFVQQNIVPCESVLRRFEIDTRYLRPPLRSIPMKNPPIQYIHDYIGIYDQFGIFWGNDKRLHPDEILYYEPLIHPLEFLDTTEKIEAYPWPECVPDTFLTGIADLATQLHTQTDYAIVSVTQGCIFEFTTFLFGFTTVMKHLRRNPTLITTAMQKLLTYWQTSIDKIMPVVGSNLDVYCINGDLATQTGPIMNPKLYHSLIQPLEQILIDYVRTYTSIPINYHSCGAISEFIPYWIEMGYNACNPVQISASNMNPAYLKKTFGDRMVFWGGLCDTQKILPFGTPAEIRAEVRRNLAAFKPQGGYIAANIHNITAEIPPENIVALFDAALEFRDY